MSNGYRMFLNKWTIQIAKQGQTDELSFASKDEALQYANGLLNQDHVAAVTLTLVDPHQTTTAIVEHAEHEA